MAETEQITILKLKTEGAESVQDLRDNIKVLKQVINETKIGTEEYQDALNLLKVNQNALKDAMYATSASLDDVKKSATGTAESYNGLVHRMAALKEELRNTDVSTKEGAKRFGELAQQVDDVNSKLKAMDELQGNFQRNVGNYQSAFKGLGEKVDGFGKGLKGLKGGAEGAKGALDAMSKTPALVVTGLLVSGITSLVSKFKESEEGTKALQAGMANLKPVMDLIRGIVSKLADILGNVIGKVSSFLGSSGLLNKIINGVMGVGNSILQFVIAPFKGVVEAIKIFKEQGVKGIGDAAKAFGKEIKSGVSFKQNFQAGQDFAETIIAGAKDKQPEVKETGKELAKSAKDGFMAEMDKLSDELDKQMEADFAAWEKKQEEANKIAQNAADSRLKSLDKAYAHQLELNQILNEDERDKANKSYEIQAEANAKRLELLEQFAKDALNRGDLDAYLQYDQERADLEVEIETNALKEKKRLREQDLKDAKEKVKQQKELLFNVAAATSSILSSIADMYESDEEASEKNANKIKGLRIAAATIDTISGAVGAYMQSVATIPPPAGIITGAIQAAAVTTAGIAQIAQMKNTQVSGEAVSTSMPRAAVVSAPTITTQVSNVRSVTSATEEDRLNQMARDQRVYILSSDIEASQRQIKTQVSESSF